MKFILLCLCLVLVSANPEKLNKAETLQVRQLSKEKLLQKVAEEIKVVQREAAVQGVSFLKSLAYEKQHAVSALTKRCLNFNWDIIEIKRTNALERSVNCSFTNIAKTAALLAADTSTYAVEMFLDGRSLVTDFVSCTLTSNPITIVLCYIKAFGTLGFEIRQIIEYSEDYAIDVKTLFPEIVHEIEACFKKSSDEYKAFLNKIIETSNDCNM